MKPDTVLMTADEQSIAMPLSRERSCNPEATQTHPIKVYSALVLFRLISYGNSAVCCLTGWKAVISEITEFERCYENSNWWRKETF